MEAFLLKIVGVSFIALFPVREQQLICER